MQQIAFWFSTHEMETHSGDTET